MRQHVKSKDANEALNNFEFAAFSHRALSNKKLNS